MTSSPLHPLVVHLPLALAVLMPMVSAGLIVAWRRRIFDRRAWLFAVLLQAALVATGLASIATGQRDEERVERVVGDGPIDRHEAAAERFVWAAGAVLLVAAAAAALRSEVTARRLALATVGGTLVVLFLGYRTGEAGGRLIYQHGAAAAWSAQGSAAATAEAESGGRDADDD